MIEQIVMLTKEYPTAHDPIYPFVQQLARGFADAGVHVTVIAPLSLTRVIRYRKQMPDRYVRESEHLTIKRPFTISLSSFAPRLNAFLFRHAAQRALPKWVDVIYGHFVAPSGLAAAQLGERLGRFSFLGYGESSPKRYASYKKEYLRRGLRALGGVIAVSSENAREVRDQQILPDDVRMCVAPNAIDPALFHPMDRAQARENLNMPQDAFIVAFVGGFNERKGVMRLSQALDRMEGVQSIFIGQGEQTPSCHGILYQGTVAHEQIPQYLAAADAFVLPTLAEGCCNAIVEALSMGLPVISSNLPFNDDILHDGNAIRIDPNSVDQIEQAILALKNDPALRARLAQNARQTARELDISSRVQKILSFMEDAAIEEDT
ncbi:glycosyltransferase family 4 protein [Eubacteriales bacterium OttesenSCG-928-N13]|nr:glycosyltransferase family 4 protein [Eubacteriales bacterium OttesenSCG-928-N13]